jgi:two-component system NarL family sensor kinase
MGPDRPAGDTARRAVIALVLTAALAFAVVGMAAYVAAQRIARTDALAEAVRTAHAVADDVFAPRLQAVLAGDRDALGALDAEVGRRAAEDTMVRATVWRRDGTVLWSDDNQLIGQRLPLAPRVAAVFDAGAAYADVSSLTDPDDRDERGAFRHLVEAFVPVSVAGTTVALEMYVPDDRVRQAERGLRDRVVPFTLLALLVLALVQLPVAIWLVRRTTAAQQDRARMLGTVLLSSERERRLLARHLHDGVVQELAGAAFLLESRRPARDEPAEPGQAGHAIGVVSRTLHRAVGDLREMLVELHPQPLTGDNLAELIAASATRACPQQVVTVTARIDRPVPPDVAAFLHRCAREGAINVAKHAAATRVEIALASDAGGIRLRIADDGVGIADPDVGPTKGHIGLALVREAAADLGGALALRGDAGGTVVTITLPPAR